MDFTPATTYRDSTVCTVIVDSIAADTVAGRLPRFVNEATAARLRRQAEADSAEAVRFYAEMHRGANSGIAPRVPGPSPADSPLPAFMMGMIVLLCLSGNGFMRAVKGYRNELWSVRRRSNAFDDVHSVSLPMSVLLALVFIVFGGVCLYFSHGIPAEFAFSGVLACMGLAAGYYLFQLCAYSLVGYAFATPHGRRQWLGGFAASQAFAGLLLAVPAMLLVCMPQWSGPVLIIAAIFYISARLIFISKGFRIFYHNFGSLLYFILYLCTLEIIPAFAVYGAVGDVIAAVS